MTISKKLMKGLNEIATYVFEEPRNFYMNNQVTEEKGKDKSYNQSGGQS